jgi:hypothetical protein
MPPSAAGNSIKITQKDPKKKIPKSQNKKTKNKKQNPTTTVQMFSGWSGYDRVGAHLAVAR